MLTLIMKPCLGWNVMFYIYLFFVYSQLYYCIYQKILRFSNLGYFLTLQKIAWTFDYILKSFVFQWKLIIKSSINYCRVFTIWSIISIVKKYYILKIIRYHVIIIYIHQYISQYNNIMFRIWRYNIMYNISFR